MLVGRILRGALKLRYLLLGGAVGGTVTLNNVSSFLKKYFILLWSSHLNLYIHQFIITGLIVFIIEI